MHSDACSWDTTIYCSRTHGDDRACSGHMVARALIYAECCNSTSQNSPFLRSWMNISGRTLAAVPAYRLAYRRLQRRRLLAERLFELGVIHHEGLLELVEHLDRLADSRIDKTHRPQQDLRCR